MLQPARKPMVKMVNARIQEMLFPLALKVDNVISKAVVSKTTVIITISIVVATSNMARVLTRTADFNNKGRIKTDNLPSMDSQPVDQLRRLLDCFCISHGVLDESMGGVSWLICLTSGADPLRARCEDAIATFLFRLPLIVSSLNIS